MRRFTMHEMRATREKRTLPKNKRMGEKELIRIMQVFPFIKESFRFLFEKLGYRERKLYREQEYFQNERSFCRCTKHAFQANWTRLIWGGSLASWAEKYAIFVISRKSIFWTRETRLRPSKTIFIIQFIYSKAFFANNNKFPTNKNICRHFFPVR